MGSHSVKCLSSTAMTVRISPMSTTRVSLIYPARPVRRGAAKAGLIGRALVTEAGADKIRGARHPARRIRRRFKASTSAEERLTADEALYRDGGEQRQNNLTDNPRVLIHPVTDLW